MQLRQHTLNRRRLDVVRRRSIRAKDETSVAVKARQRSSWDEDPAGSGRGARRDRIGVRRIALPTDDAIRTTFLAVVESGHDIVKANDAPANTRGPFLLAHPQLSLAVFDSSSIPDHPGRDWPPP